MAAAIRDIDPLAVTRWYRGVADGPPIAASSREPIPGLEQLTAEELNAELERLNQRMDDSVPPVAKQAALHRSTALKLLDRLGISEAEASALGMSVPAEFSHPALDRKKTKSK